MLLKLCRCPGVIILQIQLHMLQVKILSRLKLFNLGRFSVSFVF